MQFFPASLIKTRSPATAMLFRMESASSTTHSRTTSPRSWCTTGVEARVAVSVEVFALSTCDRRARIGGFGAWETGTRIG
jgi:hypothetical protein